jgi:hypothetical protein
MVIIITVMPYVRYFSDAIDLEQHFGALTYLGICHLLKLQELYELWELLLKFKLKPLGSKKKGNGI